MKLKDKITAEDYDIAFGDFWYDLTSGGYCDPEDLLDDQADIDKVKSAIEILQEFEKFSPLAGCL